MEGLRQQQLLEIIPRHHKLLTCHIYIAKHCQQKVHFSPAAQYDPRRIHVRARPHVHPSGLPGKTLSWHLGSESKSPLKGNHKLFSVALKSKRLLLDLLQYFLLGLTSG